MPTNSASNDQFPNRKLERSKDPRSIQQFSHTVTEMSLAVTIIGMLQMFPDEAAKFIENASAFVGEVAEVILRLSSSSGTWQLFGKVRLRNSHAGAIRTTVSSGTAVDPDTADANRDGILDEGYRGSQDGGYSDGGTKDSDELDAIVVIWAADLP